MRSRTSRDRDADHRTCELQGGRNRHPCPASSQQARGIIEVAATMQGLNRIGNMLVPNSNYVKFEEWIM